MKLIVARLADFPAGERRVVRVGGREIGVFRIDDRFYAVRNRCPHQGGPLCDGHVSRRVVSAQLGHVELGEGRLLVCPWHGWQYDMETGVPYAPDDPSVRTYDVSVERMAGLPAADSPGPVETFDVTIEDEYVVLDA